MTETELKYQQYHTAFKLRQYFYKKEADPLFLKYQREEIEKQVWLDKIAEIKTKHPYPDGFSDKDKIDANNYFEEQGIGRLA